MEILKDRGNVIRLVHAVIRIVLYESYLNLVWEEISYLSIEFQNLICFFYKNVLSYLKWSKL